MEIAGITDRLKIETDRVEVRGDGGCVPIQVHLSTGETDLIKQRRSAMRGVMNCLTVVVVGAAILSTAGCSKSGPLKGVGNRLVGAWVAEIEQETFEDQGVQVEGDEDFEFGYDFMEDGTATMDSGFGPPTSGTWEVVGAEGDTLTVKTVWQMKSYSYSSHYEGEEEPTEELEVKMEVIDKGEQVVEFSIAFETDDRMTMTPTDDPSGALTFDRRP